MKKIIACILSGTMLLAMVGCENQQEAPVTSLELMEEVNDKNILHTDPLSRIWYVIDPIHFADANGDGIGELKGIESYLHLLSDGDEKTSESDLNVNGIFIKNLIAKDSSLQPIDFTTLDSKVADEQELKDFCQKAKELNLAVMIELDTAAVSKENPDFKKLVEAANKLKDDQGIEDLPKELAEMFILSKEKTSDDWFKLGNSNLYYYGFEGADSPNINQDSAYFRDQVKKAVNYFMDLGITGFYLNDVNDFYDNDNKKNVDYVNWIYDLVKERSNDTTVVANADPYNDSMKELKVSLSEPGYSGAEGYIVKAVTSSMSAKDLGEALKAQEQRSANQAVFINNKDNTLDLLKTENRLPQLKMAMALHILMTGQVFISAGDEIGLQSDKTDLVTDAFYEPEKKDGKTEDEEGEQLELTFGSMEKQNDDGNSILNFIRQCVLLRDSYLAISSGTMNILDNLTTDQILAIQKESGSSSVILVFNLSDSEQTVDTKGVQLQGLPCELGGVLLSGDHPVRYDDDKLVLPPYCAAVLK